MLQTRVRGFKLDKNFVGKAYKDAKIKKKKIAIVKTPAVRNEEEEIKREQQITHDMIDAVRKRRRIIFVDEVIFSQKVLQTHEWSPIRHTYDIDERNLRQKVVRLYFGVSKEKGIEAFHFVDKSFDSKGYIDFLKKIDVRAGKRPVVFADNVSFHKSRETKAYILRRQLSHIYNLPYRCDLNPVEVVFSVLKRQYRKLRLRGLAQGNEVSSKTLVRRCISSLNREAIVNIVRNGMEKWQNNRFWASKWLQLESNRRINRRH